MSGPNPVAPDAADPQPPSRIDPGITDLRRHAARGTVLNSAFSIGFAGLGLLQRLIAAAFLTSEDFGLWAVILTILVTLAGLKQVGIGDKFIQQDARDQVAEFQKAFTLELLVSLVFFVIAAIALPLYALAYGHEQIIVPGLLVALIVPVNALEMPNLVPYRQLNYFRHRVLVSVNPVVAFVLTVALAIAGVGYWAFVIGVIGGAVVGAIVAVAASPYPLGLRWDTETLREYASFSWPLFGSSVSWLVVVQGSLLAANRSTGLAGIGAIGLATGIANFADRVDAIVSDTIYPAVCAVADRRELLYEAFVKSNRIALMWGLPFGTALALFSGDLITYLFGPEWEPAIGLLAAIGLITGIGQLAFNWALFLRAVNETQPIFVGAAVNLVVFFGVSLPAILTLGLPGWAVGIAAAMLVQLGIRRHYMRRLFPRFDIVRQFVRAASPVVPAAAVVLLLRALLPVERSLLLAIAELVLYGALTAALTFLLERTLVMEVVGYLRRKGTRATA